VTVHLPIYDQPSSLRSDGSRNFVHPADVHGRFDTRRKLAFVLLMVLLAALPWLEVGGHPAVFLDFEHRSFYLFGGTFNAQDAWLVFFLLTGVGFALIVTTALWGRLWCGYACPQTVFLEGLFRPIERLIEGPRATRMRRNARSMHWDKLWRKVLKHVIFVALAFVVAHIVVSYFVSLPRLYRMVLAAPAQHPEAFAWASTLTAGLYFNFFWFREQMCLIVCPYGRLQSVLSDVDTLVIGYDSRRGEPRGKAGQANKVSKAGPSDAGKPEVGDCVDCQRCVVVCPTGIDIRHGLQIDCIGCARCIDACDDIMDKLGRPAGLIRYDSQSGLAGDQRRFWRPRVYLYGLLGVLGAAVLSFALSRSQPFEANVLRLRGAPPFVLEGERVRNAFEIHLVNKRSARAVFEVSGARDPRLRYVIAASHIELGPLEDRRVPIFIEIERRQARDGDIAELHVSQKGGPALVLRAPLIVPRAR
jgi:cytochrome c oxidase accessory protein FixG